MSDLGQDIATLVRADWNELRAESVWARVRPRRRRDVVARAGVACVAAAALGGLVTMLRGEVPVPVVQVAPVEVLDVDTHMAAPEIAPPAVTRVELSRETRHFDIRDHRYEIKSGRVTIEAHNATFACSQSARTTRVEVYRGTVLVHDGSSTRELAAGEALELRDLESQRTRDPVTELLHASDVMRLGGEPAQAIGPLRRIIEHHAGDPRAALAAFTLGRLLLDDLDRPRDAAAAFADVIRLAPQGELVEDALARQVDALARAGDALAARRLAEEYAETFPRGRRLRAVRASGGLP
jgi:hypothetical protein